jgi:hypothetical protein
MKRLGKKLLLNSWKRLQELSQMKNELECGNDSGGKNEGRMKAAGETIVLVCLTNDLFFCYFTHLDALYKKR